MVFADSLDGFNTFRDRCASCLTSGAWYMRARVGAKSRGAGVRLSRELSGPDDIAAFVEEVLASCGGESFAWVELMPRGESSPAATLRVDLGELPDQDTDHEPGAVARAPREDRTVEILTAALVRLTDATTSRFDRALDTIDSQAATIASMGAELAATEAAIEVTRHMTEAGGGAVDGEPGSNLSGYMDRALRALETAATQGAEPSSIARGLIDALRKLSPEERAEILSELHTLFTEGHGADDAPGDVDGSPDDSTEGS